MGLFSSWQNFYVVVGSAGGALIGIQFVVIALIGNMRKPVDIESVNAFGTPTVVNFGGALALSAIMCAPWCSPGAASVVLTGCGIAGLAYAVVVLRRARRQKDYRPVPADWVWYVILPSGLYAALVLGGILLWKFTASALFVLGAVTLGLLLIGVRNAWDSVTHILVSELGKGEG